MVFPSHGGFSSELNGPGETTRPGVEVWSFAWRSTSVWQEDAVEAKSKRHAMVSIDHLIHRWIKRFMKRSLLINRRFVITKFII